MSEVRKVSGYRKRGLLSMVVLTVLGMLCFSFIWIGGSDGGSRILLRIGIAGLVTCVVLVIVIQDWQNRHFRCPKCGQVIPIRYVDVQQHSHTRVQFMCKRCDIIWDTGVHAA
jgi:predicted RNA-binding Zn-ribbon protein involved in translation (DUF1610 family)